MSGLSGSILCSGLGYAYSGFASAETRAVSQAWPRCATIRWRAPTACRPPRCASRGRGGSCPRRKTRSGGEGLAVADAIARPRAHSANLAIAQSFGNAAANAPASYTVVANALARSEAADINAMKTSVQASVAQDATGYRLKITRANGGTAQVFKLSIADGDGGNIDMAGLSRLAYDPGGIAGAGKNLTRIQAAQNAAYVVDGTWHERAENVVEIADGLALLLRHTGPVTVTVARDLTDLTAAAKKFVATYNDLMDAANELPGDENSKTLRAGLKRIVTDGVGGDLAFRALDEIGIAERIDATLALDAKALKRAHAKDQTDAARLLTRLAGRFEALAREYTHFDVGKLARAEGVERVDQTIVQSRIRDPILPFLTSNQGRVARAYAMTGDLVRGLGPGNALSLVS